MDPSLDLRKVRYALAVVELQLRQAASKLDIPQSTISRRVAQLERSLGICICDVLPGREADACRPTFS
ncbi:MAG: LysR family transcriptional regulator [Mesorhizobium sp.]|uniref:helix-turn-helix domain-containing protein n=1 Tax=Mesorhizobium sp. TaxID=1871066 RepID=UPI00121A0ACF|nr:MAG: LysR family transcriptional regulator [Mesorhizobium sp.]